MKRVLPKAFSLLELMVVIAIIGILAAFAGPIYKMYIGKSQLESAMNVMNGIADESIHHHALEGLFLTPAELKLPTDPNPLWNSWGNAATILPSVFSPAILSISLTNTPNDVGTCPNWGAFFFYVDPNAFGITATPNTIDAAQNMWVYYDFFLLDGQYQKYIIFSASSPELRAVGNSMPGWHDLSQEGWTYTNATYPVVCPL